MCIKEFKKKYLICSSIEKLVGALLGCDFGPFLHTNCLQILFGIIVLLKHPLWFHLHRPGGWQQIFIRNVSVHFPFTLPSVTWSTQCPMVAKLKEWLITTLSYKKLLIKLCSYCGWHSQRGIQIDITCQSLFTPSERLSNRRMKTSCVAFWLRQWCHPWRANATVLL